MKRIPVAGPWITQKEVDYAADAAANAWYADAGVYNERFEKAFAEYVGCRFAVSLPSCTAGIHLALAAAGVGKGDEVVVPDITWIASSAPVSYVGASPVFADIDERTWCLDAESLEACITPRTKAVIVVDLYGGMPDMDALRRVADRHGLTFIEDAAEAIGSEYHGRKAGSLGDVGVFSFHGSKTLTTGEGGMLVTDNEDLFRRILFLRDHGRSPGDRHFCNTEVAFKYKMSSLQAAFGLAQLERLDELIQKKRQTFDWYCEELDGIDDIALNYEADGTRNTTWMNTVILPARPGLHKHRVMDLLSEQGIDSRPFFDPLSALKAYAGSEAAAEARTRNHVSYAISPRGLNLPSALSLTQEDVRRVCDVLRSILA